MFLIDHSHAHKTLLNVKDGIAVYASEPLGD